MDGAALYISTAQAAIAFQSTLTDAQITAVSLTHTQKTLILPFKLRQLTEMRAIYTRRQYRSFSNGLRLGYKFRFKVRTRGGRSSAGRARDCDS